MVEFSRSFKSVVLPRGMNTVICAGVVSSLFCSAPIASAHGQDVLELGGIVVTARRVDEDILDVPASVSTTAVDEILDSATNEATEIARRIPNYNVIDTDWPRANFGAIRGVGNLTFPQNPFDTTIGYSLNGQPLSLFAAYLQLLDVERVEVVRGPQNVLFGRGSQGGSVNYVTKEPDRERDVRFVAEVGTDETYLTDGIIGGSIGENVAGRLAFRATGQGGFVKNNLIREELGESEIMAARSSVRFFLGPDTELTASGNFERDKRDSASFVLRDAANFPISGLDEEPVSDRDLAIGSAELEHRMDAFDFTASFSVQDIDVKSRLDTVDSVIYSALLPLVPPATFNAPRTNFNAYDQHERAYSGEVRLSSKKGANVRWIGGLSVYSSTLEQINDDISTFLPFINGTSDTELSLTTVSAFGEIGLPIAKSWTLTPSLRVGHDDFDFDNTFTPAGAPAPFFTESDSRSEGWWAGGGSLDYRVSEEAMIYGSIKRGHSAGGFSLFNGNAPFGIAQTTYPESISWTYETGAKANMLDNRVFISGAVFYNDVKDGHLFDFDFVTGRFVVAPQDYESKGFEVEARVNLDDSTTLFGGLGVTSTKLIVSGPNIPNAKPGGRVPGTPNLTFNVGIDRTWDLSIAGHHGAVKATADLQYVGDSAADIANSFDIDSYLIVNGKVGWQGDSVSIYAFGRNLTDENPELSGTLFGTNAPAVIAGRGRVVGLGAQVLF